LLLFCVNSFAQISRVEFVENKGQWEDNIHFKAKLPAGNLYLEQNELTYQFYSEVDISRFHDLHHNLIKNPTEKDYLLNLHAFKIAFVNAQTENIKGFNPTSDYVNYFIGNDESKWASNVKKYQKITYNKVYPNIDLKFYLSNNHLKYDFVVIPGGDPTNIIMEYNGVDKISLNKGELRVLTSVNEIIEQKPYAYQLIDGQEKEVKCKFKLEGNKISFSFPKGYDKTKELIIDPTLIFASYSGSTADNWGYTSTFDDAGNLYGGGVTFGVGYPTTVGAYQTNFNGGNGNYGSGCDISISKFSSNGSALLYSTYLGGIQNESPHSLIVNSNNELLVLGTTASPNFPTTPGTYDNTYNGGTSYTGTIPNYLNGSDIIVSKLSTNGAILLGSTFVGGTGNDGLNTSVTLNYNYADEFRGEIIVDASNNIYVASSTSSSDFPVTAGAFQTGLSGLQDGCVFKLSPNLNTMLWSSYIGGTNNDAAYSLQLSSLGEILITGGTESMNFPVTPGALQTVYQGLADGWVTKINNSATAILTSTYLGTPDYDQSFFVQLDTGNNVYVIGQTEGTYNITPATVYNNPNSGQFLHKLTPNLANTVFSTTIGTSSGEVDISLSAFLVNNCNYIFISGWGGAVNAFNGGAPFSTTNGLPITPGAIQSTTDGSDYYLMMLAEDADTLLYATFFGGHSSNDHVDGGTSRFDKKGIVYQAVCSSCGSATSDFPTTPGVWSNTDNSPNCNLGVFKIDLSTLTAGASVYTTPFHCVGDTVRFQNLSNGGVSYFWDFDDGDTSTLFEPVHVYTTPGNYQVMLVSLDSISCIKQDTDYVDIFISAPPVANITPVNGVCRGDSIQLNVTGGSSYAWFPNYNILNDTTATPKVWPDTTTTYTVIVSDSCGTDTATIVVQVFQKNISIIKDTAICLGQNVQISATGGGTYLWSPAATLNNANIQSPTATPLLTTVYNVQITDANTCVWDTSMTVFVSNNFPNANAGLDTLICFGDSLQLKVTGGDTYSWSPATSLSNSTDSMPIAFPQQTTEYIVSAKNGCGIDYDSIVVTVHIVDANIVDDTLVCVGNTANLWATGGVTYLWSASDNSVYSTSSTIHPIINYPTTFYVEVTDLANCTADLSVFVDTLANPILDLGFDIKSSWGNLIQLNPVTNAVSFWWTPPTGLSCTDCPNPIVKAKESTTYYLKVQGANGCFSYDTITVFYDGAIYVPNSFTPNGDGDNDVFYVYGVDIVDFELYIFDRWGEQLFHTTDMKMGWDGIYNGNLVQTESYVWKVRYKDIIGHSGELYGTVTLIR
jgi:gliding motility-associated-like protein